MSEAPQYSFPALRRVSVEHAAALERLSAEMAEILAAKGVRTPPDNAR